MEMPVTETDYDSEHDFVCGFIQKKLRFKIRGSNVIYSIEMINRTKYVKLIVTSTSQDDFRLECSVVQGDRTATKIVNKSESECYWRIDTFDMIAHVKLTFRKPGSVDQPVAGTQQVVEPWVARKQEFSAVSTDLQMYIERGPNVQLVGNDGTVTVPKRLLELRSEALEMILNSDSQENRTKKIELNDFNAKTLDSFASFLMDKKIKDGIETATGLILLGDKYNIQVMKSAAEDFVKKNIQAMDKEEVFDVLSLVNKDLLMQTVVDAWSNGH